ncbi:MAG: hypothetical protein Unbinned1190contig1000_24 [Prokaryotic dsDNA virus sp.]|nr:MAG: hypothetical protein Unbinned1190contig1000_24 [Prokaryotic dsDNA virus sp.]|tara:strand:+ start:11916 stop:12200 length:285 start_codon:yes stop_codon:yes gene_type:complete
MTDKQLIKKAEDLGMYFDPEVQLDPAIKLLAASRFLRNHESGDYDNAADNGLDALLYATIRHSFTDEEWEQRQQELRFKYPELVTANDNEGDQT